MPVRHSLKNSVVQKNPAWMSSRILLNLAMTIAAMKEVKQETINVKENLVHEQSSACLMLARLHCIVG